MTRRAPTTLLICALAFAFAALPQPSPAHGARGETIWLPPLGSPLRISAPFDLPHGPFRAGHRGIDIDAASAARVSSPTGGVVAFVGTVVDRPVLSIKVDNSTVVSFEPVISSLQVGDTLARGDPLGTVSSGSHCSGVCLHLGVRVTGEYVNPMRFFAGRAKLVPW